MSDNQKEDSLDKFSALCKYLSDETLDDALEIDSKSMLAPDTRIKAMYYVASINSDYIGVIPHALNIIRRYEKKFSDEIDPEKRYSLLRHYLEERNLVYAVETIGGVLENDKLFDSFVGELLGLSEDPLYLSAVDRYILNKRHQIDNVRQQAKAEYESFLLAVKFACPKMKVAEMGDILKIRENLRKAEQARISGQIAH